MARNPGPCAVDGCERRGPFRRGYCGRHYARFRLTGSVEAVKWGRDPARVRFYDRIEMVPESGCWIWTGTVNPKGYGYLRLNGVGTFAHRLSWQLHRGEVPADLCVCHKCDVPSCCNPNHLFLGTRGDNNHDTKKKGRSVIGERNGCAKLTAADVHVIRTRRANGEGLQRIADDFGIGNMQVSRIARFQRWQHLEKLP